MSGPAVLASPDWATRDDAGLADERIHAGGLVRLRIACALSSVSAALGARLTLHASQLESLQGAANNWKPSGEVPGDWQVSGTILPEETITLAPPRGGVLGSSTIVFTNALASPGAVEVSFQFRGAASEPHGAMGSAIQVSVIDAGGRRVSQVSVRAQGASVVELSERSESDAYQLTLSL